jgi:hypothetical protein
VSWTCWILWSSPFWMLHLLLFTVLQRERDFGVMYYCFLAVWKVINTDVIPCLMLMCRTYIAFPALLKITSGLSVIYGSNFKWKQFFFSPFSSATVREFVQKKYSPFFAGDYCGFFLCWGNGVVKIQTEMIMPCHAKKFCNVGR